jgi:hypothetical protein
MHAENSGKSPRFCVASRSRVVGVQHNWLFGESVQPRRPVSAFHEFREHSTRHSSSSGTQSGLVSASRRSGLPLTTRTWNRQWIVPSIGEASELGNEIWPWGALAGVNTGI